MIGSGRARESDCLSPLESSSIHVKMRFRLRGLGGAASLGRSRGSGSDWIQALDGDRVVVVFQFEISDILPSLYGANADFVPFLKWDLRNADPFSILPDKTFAGCCSDGKIRGKGCSRQQ